MGFPGFLIQSYQQTSLPRKTVGYMSYSTGKIETKFSRMGSEVRREKFDRFCVTWVNPVVRFHCGFRSFSDLRFIITGEMDGSMINEPRKSGRYFDEICRSLLESFRLDFLAALFQRYAVARATNPNSALFRRPYAT